MCVIGQCFCELNVKRFQYTCNLRVINVQQVAYAVQPNSPSVALCLLVLNRSVVGRCIFGIKFRQEIFYLRPK